MNFRDMLRRHPIEHVIVLATIQLLLIFEELKVMASFIKGVLLIAKFVFIIARNELMKVYTYSPLHYL